MLDTDTVSFILRDQGDAPRHFRNARPSDICMSSLTLAELRRGARLTGSLKIMRLIETFVDPVLVVSFGKREADRYGLLASQLIKRGLPIGHFDTLIAAHSLALDLTLVSHNRKHFRKVPGLKVVDWF